ncbi:MAG: N-acetyltransferase [Candidatus Zixiibacteriota bacterium]|nr:MAG: N-acetyltransferase [candidate division Zixibacteria bacterium]
MNLTVHRLDATRREDFYRLHSSDNHHQWCFCVAWHLPSWVGWPDWPASRNRHLREELFSRREYDGYLLYADGLPAGWCQAAPRDSLIRTRSLFHLPPDPEAWAVTCFFIAPQHRRQGLATHLLKEVLNDLPSRGVRRVQAFPKRQENPGDGDLWNGPETLFRRAGFTLLRDDPQRPVLVLEF